jgi:hypothetical protein
MGRMITPILCFGSELELFIVKLRIYPKFLPNQTSSSMIMVRALPEAQRVNVRKALTQDQEP